MTILHIFQNLRQHLLQIGLICKIVFLTKIAFSIDQVKVNAMNHLIGRGRFLHDGLKLLSGEPFNLFWRVAGQQMPIGIVIGIVLNVCFQHLLSIPLGSTVKETNWASIPSASNRSFNKAISEVIRGTYRITVGKDEVGHPDGAGQILCAKALHVDR